MIEMKLQTEKLEIMKLILETDNPSLLKSIKMLFWKQQKADFWETLPEDHKEDILEGIKDIERGDVVDYDKFMERFR